MSVVVLGSASNSTECPKSLAIPAAEANMRVFKCKCQSKIMSHFRSLFVRIMNYCWFWDLERSFPGYPQFDVAENILHTVNNQG